MLQDRKKCPRCGNLLPLDEVKCGFCGQAVGKPRQDEGGTRWKFGALKETVQPEPFVAWPLILSLLVAGGLGYAIGFLNWQRSFFRAIYFWDACKQVQGIFTFIPLKFMPMALLGLVLGTVGTLLAVRLSQRCVCGATRWKILRHGNVDGMQMLECRRCGRRRMRRVVKQRT